MIDWYNLIMNALWVLGCAVVLATLSYASWEASEQGKTFRDCISQSHIQIALNIGGLLFCAGLAGTADIVWQQILWIILGFGFLAQIASGFLKKNKN